MTEEQFKKRTRKLALDAVLLVDRLPRNTVSLVFGKQLIRCASSVGANYRSAWRARSKADMLSRLAVSEEEADETLYWLDLIVSANLCEPIDAKPLEHEADQILSMLVAFDQDVKA